MSWKGREQVGSCTQDNLIAGSRHPLDICQVVIKAGQNLKRGTLLEEEMCIRDSAAGVQGFHQRSWKKSGRIIKDGRFFHVKCDNIVAC